MYVLDWLKTLGHVQDGPGPQPVPYWSGCALLIEHVPYQPTDIVKEGGKIERMMNICCMDEYKDGSSQER